MNLLGVVHKGTLEGVSPKFFIRGHTKNACDMAFGSTQALYYTGRLGGRAGCARHRGGGKLLGGGSMQPQHVQGLQACGERAVQERPSRSKVSAL